MSTEITNTNSSRQIATNVLYGFSTWFLPLLLSFIATPIIVRALGDADYGIYALVLGFIGYSFTFSIGRAITNYVSEFRPKGESEKIREVISATLLLNLSVGLFGVALICLSAPWLVRDVLRIAPDAQEKTVHALYCAALIIFFTMMGQVFHAIVQGVHRFDVYAKILNIGNFASLLGNLAFALSGFGLLVLLGWNLFVTFAMLIVVAISARSLLPEVPFKFRFKSETAKFVLRFSFGIVGYQLLANLLLLFERGWITRKLGSESLTYYVVPMTLGMYVHGFVSSLMLVIFPLAGELKNDREKLIRLYFTATKIACLIVFFLATTLIIESNFFLKIYLGETFAERSSTLLILHAVSFGAAAILSVSWQMTEGLGFPNYNFFVFGICLIISVTLMILLTPTYANFGIGVARLVGFCTILFSIIYVENWFFKKVQTQFWLRTVGTLAIASAVSGALQYLLIRNLNTNWFSFLFVVGCGACVYLLTLWLLRFVSEDEKNLIRGVLRR